ncbi:MAG: hypothetical protein EZS28_020040, partial [Streblomastix strix]
MCRCNILGITWAQIQQQCPILNNALCKSFPTDPEQTNMPTYFFIFTDEQLANFLIINPQRFRMEKEKNDRAILFSRARHNTIALVCGPKCPQTVKQSIKLQHPSIRSYKQYQTRSKMVFVIHYSSRFNADTAYNIAQTYGFSIGINFVSLDNKVLFNEIMFKFNISELGDKANIFNQAFTEQLILIDLQRQWGQNVCRVSLNFDSIGNLTGKGQVTFENEIESEINVDNLIQQNKQNMFIDVLGIRFRYWKKEQMRDSDRKKEEANLRDRLRYYSQLDELVQLRIKPIRIFPTSESQDQNEVEFVPECINNSQ